MYIKDHSTRFSNEDTALFAVISTHLALLPDKLDLCPENDEEDKFLYGRAYYEMLTWALSLELNLDRGLVFLGGSGRPIPALNFPSGKKFVISIPNTLSTGPTLFSGSPGEVYVAHDGSLLEEKPDWFQRGVHTFREGLHARMRAPKETSGHDGSREMIGEPTQPI